jgi:hypothetical protein
LVIGYWFLANVPTTNDQVPIIRSLQLQMPLRGAARCLSEERPVGYHYDAKYTVGVSNQQSAFCIA